MSGEVRAIKPGQYEGEARFHIGRRMVLAKPIEGRLRTRWSRLSVSLKLSDRRRIRQEARRTCRRPLLKIQLKYYLSGKKQYRLRLREFIVSLKSCP
jgi:hypothetical protein